MKQKKKIFFKRWKQESKDEEIRRPVVEVQIQRNTAGPHDPKSSFIFLFY